MELQLFVHSEREARPPRNLAGATMDPTLAAAQRARQKTEALLTWSSHLQFKLAATLRICREQRERFVSLPAPGRPGPQSGRLRWHLRRWLGEGSLPPAKWATRVGEGTGRRSCAACDTVIVPPDAEYVVPTRDGPMFAHFACYIIWKEESAASAAEERPKASLSLSATRRQRV